MLRIRIDDGWKQDPSTIRGLRALGEKGGVAFSPRDIVGVLHFVADGVDLAQGTAETGVLDAMQALLEASQALLYSPGERNLLLQGARTRLVLQRESDELCLRIFPFEYSEDSAALSLPPHDFYATVRSAALRFVDELCALAPQLSDSRVVARLRMAAKHSTSKLAKAGETKGKGRRVRKDSRAVQGYNPRLLINEQVGRLTLCVDTQPLRLLLRGPRGQIVWQSQEGPREAAIALSAAMSRSLLQNRAGERRVAELDDLLERLNTALAHEYASIGQASEQPTLGQKQERLRQGRRLSAASGDESPLDASDSDEVAEFDALFEVQAESHPSEHALFSPAISEDAESLRAWGPSKTRELKTRAEHSLRPAGGKAAIRLGVRTESGSVPGSESGAVSGPESRSGSRLKAYTEAYAALVNVERQSLLFADFEIPFLDFASALERIFDSGTIKNHVGNRGPVIEALSFLRACRNAGLLLRGREPEEFKARAREVLSLPSLPSLSPLKPSVPVGGGEIRHLFFRRLLFHDFIGSSPAFHHLGKSLLLSSSEGIGKMLPDGELGWFREMRWSAIRKVGGRTRIVGQGEQGELLCLAPGSGRVVWRRNIVDCTFRDLHPLADGSMLLLGDTSLLKLNAEGRQEWIWDGQFEEAQILGSRQGVVFSHKNELFGIDASGEVLWNRTAFLRLPQLFADPSNASLIVMGECGDDGLELHSLSIESGKIRWSHGLAHATDPHLLLYSRRLFLGFDDKGGPGLLGLNTRNGEVDWKVKVKGKGAVRPVRSEQQLLVDRKGGGLVALNLQGEVLYYSPPADPQLGLSPKLPPKVVAGGGLVLVAGALVHVYEQSSGRLLCSLQPELYAPDAIALREGQVIHAANESTESTDTWHPRGHMRVLPSL